MSGWFERGDPWRRLDLERGEDRALRLGRRGGLLDGAGRSLQGDEVEALQLGRDPPPALVGSSLGDPDQEQGEPAGLRTAELRVQIVQKKASTP